MRRRLALVACLAAFAASTASAETFPSKPIHIVVGFAAGGPADVMSRLIGQKMQQIVGQPLIVDNRAGAGGSIGAKSVAEADPDGYTLLLSNTSNIVISPLVYRNVGYDPAKAFAPIALLGTTSNLLVVHPSVKANTVRELVALAKANPGRLNFSSPGAGTPPHLIGELFKQRTGVDILHVPYKGGGQSSQAVVAGEVQMTFENPTTSMPLVQGGRVRALAVTSETRNPQAPDIPTMAEAGIPDFVSVSFTGVVAPAGTPPDIVTRLNAAINESLKAPEVRDALTKLAVETRIGTPGDFGAFLTHERAKWTAIVRGAHIQAE